MEIKDINREQEEAVHERTTQYRKRYWQDYKAKHPRIFGTVSPAEFEEIKRIAEANERSVWTQVWLESLAYRQQTFVPPQDIRAELSTLSSQLRQINDTLSTLGSKSGAIQNLMDTRQVSSQLRQLDKSMAEFFNRPWKKP